MTVAGVGRRVRVPGQYVSVGVTLPDGARQLRQYSLVNAGGTGELTFAVKPAGEVSNWIRDNVRVGDLLDVTLPFGDLPAPTPGAPLVLISAGIGVTPMIGILETLDADARVQVLHADRSARPTRCGSVSANCVADLPNATLDVWYEDGGDGAHPGFLTLDGIVAAGRRRGLPVRRATASSGRSGTSCWPVA